MCAKKTLQQLQESAWKRANWFSFTGFSPAVWVHWQRWIERGLTAEVEEGGKAPNPSTLTGVKPMSLMDRCQEMERLLQATEKGQQGVALQAGRDLLQTKHCVSPKAQTVQVIQSAGNRVHWITGLSVRQDWNHSLQWFHTTQLQTEKGGGISPGWLKHWQ